MRSSAPSNEWGQTDVCCADCFLNADLPREVSLRVGLHGTPLLPTKKPTVDTRRRGAFIQSGRQDLNLRPLRPERSKHFTNTVFCCFFESR